MGEKQWAFMPTKAYGRLKTPAVVQRALGLAADLDLAPEFPREDDDAGSGGERVGLPELLLLR